MEVRFVNGTHDVSARLEFDGNSDLVNFVSDDRAALQDDGTLAIRRWSTPVDSLGQVEGRRVPILARTVYEMPDGPFTYGAFRLVRLRIDPQEP